MEYAAARLCLFRVWHGALFTGSDCPTPERLHKLVVAGLWKMVLSFGIWPGVHGKIPSVSMRRRRRSAQW
jgi:hypothetical protein